MDDYENFISRVKDIQKIGALQGHLGWDQETIMPPKGAESRAEILSWLAKEQHDRTTDPELGELIKKLSNKKDLNQDQLANLIEIKRRHEKAQKLPSDFVVEFTKTKSEALSVWQQARQESDFELFKPKLQKLIDMTKKKINYYGIDKTPYDTLLDEFEIGMTVDDYDPLFDGLKQRLVPLLQKIMEAKEIHQDPELPEGMVFPIDGQVEFCTKVSKAMGFDFEAGRMDVSTHPFSAGLWPGDTRFTTRFDEKDPFSCLYAVMHEVGHALYEQGLLHEHSFTPRGDAVSLGVHESQSRFWENQIGRTPSFWHVVFPWFKEQFPEASKWSPEVLNQMANSVTPDYIRVEADEVTYNLHVMLRYEIEKQIFNEDLAVEDLPKVWNSMFEDWFGLIVPNDALGCLQDVHWSMGAFGYFPTYTLGNLYASQLLQAMSKDLGDIDEIIKSGDWSSLLDWLKPRIHHQGSKWTPSELIKRATGTAPTPEPFLRYVEEKYSNLYNLD